MAIDRKAGISEGYATFEEAKAAGLTAKDYDTDSGRFISRDEALRKQAVSYARQDAASGVPLTPNKNESPYADLRTAEHRKEGVDPATLRSKSDGLISDTRKGGSPTETPIPMGDLSHYSVPVASGPQASYDGPECYQWDTEEIKASQLNVQLAAEKFLEAKEKMQNIIATLQGYWDSSDAAGLFRDKMELERSLTHLVRLSVHMTMLKLK